MLLVWCYNTANVWRTKQRRSLSLSLYLLLTLCCFFFSPSFNHSKFLGMRNRAACPHCETFIVSMCFVHNWHNAGLFHRYMQISTRMYQCYFLLCFVLFVCLFFSPELVELLDAQMSNNMLHRLTKLLTSCVSKYHYFYLFWRSYELFLSIIALLISLLVFCKALKFSSVCLVCGGRGCWGVYTRVHCRLGNLSPIGFQGQPWVKPIRGLASYSHADLQPISNRSFTSAVRVCVLANSGSAVMRGIKVCQGRGSHAMALGQIWHVHTLIHRHWYCHCELATQVVRCHETV